MTIYSHDMVMKRANVSQLKARLSSYLADVRSGDTVIVCERATPIAQLTPLAADAEELIIREAVKPIRSLKKIRPVRMKRKTDVDKLLTEMRGES